jgi:hypothetical protein
MMKIPVQKNLPITSWALKGYSRPAVGLGSLHPWTLKQKPILLPVIIPAIAFIEHTPPAKIITYYFL